jgi:nucleoside 2-deoxyribosyltransferase
MRVYLAGPLFTAAERLFNARLRDLLAAAGHEVWLPQEREPVATGVRETFLTDIEGLDWSEAVIANMDGPDPDSGTCWECGYAYCKKKKIILFRTDFRRAGEAGLGPYNLMLAASADERVDLPSNTASNAVEVLAGKLLAALDIVAEKHAAAR